MFVNDPPYTIGSSWADPLINQDDLYYEVPSGTVPPLGAGSNSAYSVLDKSYLCNEALWDTYFFSTLFAQPNNPAGSLSEAQVVSQLLTNPSFTLPNSQITLYRSSNKTTAQITSDLSNYATASGDLLVQGAFNVNSTSYEAWKAVLSGLSNQTIEQFNPNGPNGTIGPYTVTNPFFSRFQTPFAQDYATTQTTTSQYLGLVPLTSSQLSSLAQYIVQEVKTRGPFLSLADFVNRRLTSSTDTTNPYTAAMGLRGPLQAAIDNSGINTTANGNTGTFGSPTAPATPASFVSGNNQPIDVHAGAPGYLQQSDILAAIGPSLTARSDTFLIRAYGDACNEKTGAVEGQAWCEAVVQRVPDPVVPSASNPMAPANPAMYGRRFQIISFRFLEPSEI
jgi:hypothetical protein